MNSSNICECPDIYSIEPHGNGWALYLGRCPHRHGYNLAYITEPDLPRLNLVLQKLNGELNKTDSELERQVKRLEERILQRIQQLENKQPPPTCGLS